MNHNAHTWQADKYSQNSQYQYRILMKLTLGGSQRNLGKRVSFYQPLANNNQEAHYVDATAAQFGDDNEQRNVL